MNNANQVQVISAEEKFWFKPAFRILIGILILTASLGLGLYLYIQGKPKNSQPPIDQTPQEISQTISGPQVSRFTAFVKEINNNKLIIETQDETPQITEIPLDNNVIFEAWVKKDGPDKPPALQSAASSDLKIGQKVDIFKSEVSGRPSFFEITIYNE